jgi:transaldolase
MATRRLHELSSQGVSVWVDSLSRGMLETGELARLVREDAVVGETSNPTIFEHALSTGDWYDDRLREALEGLSDAKDVFFALAIEDIRDACDLFRPIWERTDGVDGRVSLEVDPDLAYERAATFEQATKLHDRVDRQNLYVKIPATVPGLGAIEDSIAAGRSINVTLIFSLERHAEVAEAYVRGLERFVASGGNPHDVISVASFFVSRVDTETDRRLAEVDREDLAGRLGIANARLAYQQYLSVFSGDRWQALAAAGARPQRCLWASTSTKNPAYRDVMYVEALVGPDTVNTMPFETIAAFQDHGEVRGHTLLEGVDEARRLLDDLAEAGVDYDDVVRVLEEEGVKKFSDSFGSLLDGIEAKRSALVA